MCAISIQATAGSRTRILGFRQKICASLALAFFPITFTAAEDLHAYTEEWPPYNYTEGSEIKGISTEIFLASCEAVKINCQLHMVPWARAYKTVLDTPNTLIYSIARTQRREKQFVWIGPILPRTSWIYGKAEMAASIHSLKDLAGARIGVTREDASLDELLTAGVPRSSITVLNSNTDTMKMLKLGKINVVLNTEMGMAFNLQNTEIPSDEISKLMKMSDGGLYFALNLQSDPVLIDKLQSSIDKLKREGKIDAIVRSYTKEKN